MLISPVPGISMLIHLLIVLIVAFTMAIKNVLLHIKKFFALIVVMTTSAAVVFSMAFIILMSYGSKISNIRIIQRLLHEQAHTINVVKDNITIPNNMNIRWIVAKVNDINAYAK